MQFALKEAASALLKPVQCQCLVLAWQPDMKALLKVSGEATTAKSPLEGMLPNRRNKLAACMPGLGQKAGFAEKKQKLKLLGPLSEAEALSSMSCLCSGSYHSRHSPASLATCTGKPTARASLSQVSEQLRNPRPHSPVSSKPTLATATYPIHQPTHFLAKGSGAPGPAFNTRLTASSPEYLASGHGHRQRNPFGPSRPSRQAPEAKAPFWLSLPRLPHCTANQTRAGAAILVKTE